MTRKECRIAAAVLALLLPALAALWWAARQSALAPQPGALATFTLAGQDHAAFVFDGALHVTDAAGRRIARQDLAALGLSAEPTDMDWTVAPDGRAEAWFFDDGGPRIVRCTWDAAVARLRDCAAVIAGAHLKRNAASRAVHLAVDAARGRVFVADARGHAVRAFAFDGRELATSEAGALRFPNRLRVRGDALVVADNDHRRLAWLDIAGDPPSLRVRRWLSLDAHPQGAGRKAADFALLERAGRLQGLGVLAVRPGQVQGRVLLYDANLQPAGVADLGGHADPLVLDGLGEALLVADFDGVAFYRVAADGRYLGSFGEDAVQDELQQARARLRAGDRWQAAGWAILAIALVAGFALAGRHSEKRGVRALREAFARLEGIAPAAASHPPVELRPAPLLRCLLLVSAALPLLLLAASLVPVVALWPGGLPPAWRQSPPPWPLVLVVTGFVALTGAVVATSLRHARQRLWIGEGRVQVRIGARVLADAPLGDVRASASALLVGRVLLPYRLTDWRGRPGRWLYDRETLARYLLVRLAPHQRLPQPELARERMRRLPGWVLAVLLAPVAACGLWLAWRAWG